MTTAATTRTDHDDLLYLARGHGHHYSHAVSLGGAPGGEVVAVLIPVAPDLVVAVTDPNEPGAAWTVGIYTQAGWTADEAPQAIFEVVEPHAPVDVATNLTSGRQAETGVEVIR